MTDLYYHLAEVNIARARAPLEHSVMAGFVGQLAAVNALADSSPGFVWRLQSDAGDNTYLRPYDDPLIIFNLSVWESVDALRQYVYRSQHVAAVRDRKLWFEKMEAAQVALWWVPAGHLPKVEEAKQRLLYLQQHGEGPMAFSFSQPADVPMRPEVEPAILAPSTMPWSYDGKIFALSSRPASGDCGPGTFFRYRQQGSRVWATYEGDGVRFGSLVAVANDAAGMHGCYQHLTSRDEVCSGHYTAVTEFLRDSRMVIREDWRAGSRYGRSILEQVV